MNIELPLYVLVSYHSSLKGALPLKGIVMKLGGLLKVSTVNMDIHTQVYFFDQELFGRVFMRLVTKADAGFVVTALNSTDYR